MVCRGQSRIKQPGLSFDDGCGTVDWPVALGPWDGKVDSNDSCTVTYTADLTGVQPEFTFPYSATIGNATFSLSLVVPRPPVPVSTGGGTIDFGTGDTSASGDYDSYFAPAAVTVTKTNARAIACTAVTPSPPPCRRSSASGGA